MRLRPGGDLSRGDGLPSVATDWCFWLEALGFRQQRRWRLVEGYGDFGEAIDRRTTATEFDERNVVTIEFGGKGQLFLT